MKLLDMARRIVPVHLRVKPLVGPVSGIMLCDYRTSTFNLQAGQHVIVLANAAESEVSISESSGSCSCMASSKRAHTDRRPHYRSPTSDIACCECDTQKNQHPMSSDEQSFTSSTAVTEQTRCSTCTLGGEIGEDEEYEDESSGIIDSQTRSTNSMSCQCEHLMWKVRTPNGTLEVEVPAVTVMINETDVDAIDNAFR